MINFRIEAVTDDQEAFVDEMEHIASTTEAYYVLKMDNETIGLIKLIVIGVDTKADMIINSAEKDLLEKFGNGKA